MEAYTYLAQVYDKMMGDVDAAMWAAYIHKFLKEYDVEKVLDVACGTGSITRQLEQYGYDIVASDISGEMLCAAKEAARQCGSGILFIQQDMRDIMVGNPVDAIISTCDGVNYIDEEGIRKFASAACDALKPGGVLLFDISAKHKLKDVMDGEIYFDDGEDATCIWANAYDIEKDALLMDVTVFVRRGQLFERMTEQHIQYAHEQEALQKILLDTGFKHADIYECFTEKTPSETSERLQFVCVKELAESRFIQNIVV